jgi:hypothetical protein
MNNKRGFIGGADSFVFGFVGLFILLLVLICLIPVEQGDVTANKTLTALITTQNNTLSNFVTSENNTVISNVLYSMLYFVCYSAFEVTKLAVTYGMSHPEVINPKALLWLIIISLAIPIAFYVIRFIALIIVLVSEIVHSRRDKRKFKALDKKKGELYGSI